MSDTQSPQETFDRLKNNVTNAISKHFPFDGRLNRLEMKKIWVDDDLHIDDIASQAQAKDHERTWGVPVKAEIHLVDKKTGGVIDKQTMTLARLPKLTNRHGYIVDGNEYQVDQLFRWKPGVYARQQANGELKAEFNLPKGKGFSIFLDPKKKSFKIRQGTSNIPLYPILKALGTKDEDLEKAWGPQVLAANRVTEKQHDAALKTFFEKTNFPDTPKPDSHHGLEEHIRSYYAGTELLPETTKITLGQPFSQVNGEVMRLATEKVLGISRGTHEQDNRDSLMFKHIAGIEDFIPEKIDRAERNIITKLRATVDHKKSVRDIVVPDVFGKPVNEFFKKGGSVTERSEQTNPLQMINGSRKTTLVSDVFGGIGDDHKLTTDMRVIDPSHFGFLDPMHTPESERTGITLYMNSAARKNGKDLETPVYDTKTGKTEFMNAITFHNVHAVLPDQVHWEHGKPVPTGHTVKVKTPGGDIAQLPFKDMRYVIPSQKGMFDTTSNLIPFLPCNQGNRVSMADKQLEQAISLTHREQPLVQSMTKGGSPEDTYEHHVGKFASTISPHSGKVTAVTADAITIHEGKTKHIVPLYNHFPLNDPKGMMHSSPPVVKVGDEVKKGDLLADSNYTNKGRLAIGTNLRVGYIPYKGYNFEDGIVISESAAKKLTSEHLHKKKIEIDNETSHISKRMWLANLGAHEQNLKKAHLDALDDDGIIKPGSKVEPGQILIASVKKNENMGLKEFNKKGFNFLKNNSMMWDHDHTGEVIKVVKDADGKGVKVHIKTSEPMVVGDKLSGRHGNKGIVTMILPDHDMPHTKDAAGEAKHLDVLLNPSGIPTRINIGQMLETAAAKIAEKTGKTYMVDNFATGNHDYRQHVLDDLKKHGLTDEEMVWDPKDQRKPLGSVLVGPQYLLKLRHQVEKKLSVRGGGTSVSGKPLPVDTDMQPTKGVGTGGQGFGQLDVYTLLGHNARANLREMATYKSDYQDATFWSMIQQGHEPPPPKPSFAYEKFIGLLKGAGVNVEKHGTGLRLQPLTDKEVLHMGGPHGELKKPHLTIRAKDFKEERHGLFDEGVTGGLDGKKWSYIRLSEPVANPIFVGTNNKPGPVPALLGMKLADVEAVLNGHHELGGKTGGAAIEEALKRVDVDKELADAKAKLPSLKSGSELDRLNKKMKYLLSLKELGYKPHEAYIMHYLPVIPPAFRPVTTTYTGDIQFASTNGLYKNIALVNNKLNEFNPAELSQVHKQPLQAALYGSVKALQAVGGEVGFDPDARGQKRKLKGILDIIGNVSGESQPKEGYFQSKLIKRRQNLSIRSTIVPEPSLHIDEVGLPRNAAMEMYKPFVVAEMGKMGYNPLPAQDEIKKGSDIANKALERALADRPMLLKRDPALHKFSIMAFRPKIVEGKAIRIHPLVTGGFNADFDGDTMAGVVPMSREAVAEAYKMLPSKNLFNPTSGRVMHMPGQEALLGLHLLSEWGKPSGKSFTNPIEANKAFEKGDIQASDVIKIGGKETTVGRYLLESRLPRGHAMSAEILHDPKFLMGKSVLSKVGTQLAKAHPTEFASSIDMLKDLGNSHSFKVGYSFGLADLAHLPARDKILADAHKEVEHLKHSVKDPAELEEKTIAAYQDATQKLGVASKLHYSDGKNRLAKMVYSGSRGSEDQLRQMVAAPMLMQNGLGKTIPTPVTRSYAEGLDVGDYWLSQHGARKGTMQRALGTSLPGVAAKNITNIALNNLIVSQDCGTNQGILMPTGPKLGDDSHKDTIDRYTAAPYKLKDGSTVKAGSLITPEVMSRLHNSKHENVLVRSPLKCQHGDGLCAKCFGLNENGKLHEDGTNIGVLAGQALSEPAVQMAMDAFHAGGIATGRGAASVDRFTRMSQLMEMPKHLKNAATLSRKEGVISDIQENKAVGGHDVIIDGERHFVPAQNKLTVEKGHKVFKGQALSSGPINPHQLLPLTSIHKVQNYITDELYNGIYAKEGVRKRNIETVVRSLTDLTYVKEPGHSEYLHGDIMPRALIEEHNRNLPHGQKPVLHDPILKGIKQVEEASSTDWMSRLNYTQLAKTIMTGAAQGWKSDLHGTSPIPGLAYGAELGKPPHGKPQHNY